MDHYCSVVVDKSEVKSEVKKIRIYFTVKSVKDTSAK